MPLVIHESPSQAGFGWGGLNLEGGLFDVERHMYSVNVDVYKYL